MKKIIILFICLIAFSTAYYYTKNNKAEKNYTFSLNSEKVFFAMGTVVNIIYESKDENKIKDIISEIQTLEKNIKEDEKKLNMIEQDKPVILSSDIIELYKNASELYKISNGLYDPTSITAASLYGFPDKKFQIPDDKILEKAKKQAGLTNIIYNDKYFMKKTNALIDFSASSKGYIVDKTVKYMKDKGMKNFIVNAGGDMYVDGLKYGKSKFNIFIEKPAEEKEYISIIKLTNKAVATSGNYERFFIDNKTGRRITHIFQGVTFEPVDNYQSISVIAENTKQADSLATLYFLSNINDIKHYCLEFKTPVLIYTLDNKTIKLCSWQDYEYLQ